MCFVSGRVWTKIEAQISTIIGSSTSYSVSNSKFIPDFPSALKKPKLGPDQTSIVKQLKELRRKYKADHVIFFKFIERILLIYYQETRDLPRG